MKNRSRKYSKEYYYNEFQFYFKECQEQSEIIKDLIAELCGTKDLSILNKKLKRYKILIELMRKYE